jgi:enoyl-CoA hydratase/carnithine racemase
MSEEPVLYTRQDHVATITLNRPDRLNALSLDLLVQLSARLAEANADLEVRVVVLTGAGRGFCAGYDLKDEMEGKGLRSQAGNLPEGFSALTPPLTLHNMDKPTLCALNGSAAGYGLDLALGCDIRLMAAEAKLAPAFAKIGLLPESGGTWLLPRMIGWSKACEILLRGAPLTAEEALAFGVVSRVVPRAELMEATVTLAQEIAANAPLSMQATKRAMRLGMEQSFEANVEHVLGVITALFQTADFTEGVLAYAQRRKPEFTGT